MHIKQSLLVVISLWGTSAMAQNPSIGDFFNKSNVENMQQQVEAFYDANVQFEDPIKEIQGREGLLEHYLKLYKDVKRIRFEMGKEVVQGDDVAATWVMHMEHPKLNGGDEIHVKGISLIKFKDKKAIYHRDYFDLGEMVYEHVTIVGSLVRMVKNRLKD